MNSIAPPPSYQRSIWKCACACSFYRQTRKCKNEFDSVACNSCQLYIKQYTSLDQAAMRLYMLEADTHAKQVRREARSQDVKNFFATLVIIGIIGFFGWIAWNTMGRILWKYFVIPHPANQTIATADLRVASEREVWYTLYEVKNNLHDVNKDGTVNCQDYAILFYKYYPYPESVRILYNPEVILRAQVYKPTGQKTRAHLFNEIYEGKTRGWQEIEPQSANFPRRQGSYYMWYHVLHHNWNLYRRKYNKDVTATYSKYAK